MKSQAREYGLYYERTKHLTEVMSMKKMILMISMGHTEYFQTEVPSYRMVTILLSVFPRRIRWWMGVVGDRRMLSTVFNQDIPTLICFILDLLEKKILLSENHQL